MKEVPYLEALEAFDPILRDYKVEVIPGGLINQSFKIHNPVNNQSLLLQRINTHVFSNPVRVQENYEILWNHLEQHKIPYFLPEPRYFPNGQLVFVDRQKNYWRIFEYVKDAETKAVAQTVSQAHAVAETFARFTASFKDLDAKRLFITIPGFHDLSLRYRQFEKSLHSGRFERLHPASELIKEMKQREHYASFYEVIAGSDEFPLRVMHHDAKISNVLFEKDTGRVICPVDLDTVMPGYFFSDLGDMIRSMACNNDENSPDIESIQIRKDFYEAILEGYMSVMEKQFTSSEKKYIHYAGIQMIYMQALRFLADFLNGDTYYKTNYPDQNYDRAKNQLALLKSLENFLQETDQFKS